MNVALRIRSVVSIPSARTCQAATTAPVIQDTDPQRGRRLQEMTHLAKVRAFYIATTTDLFLEYSGMEKNGSYNAFLSLSLSHLNTHTLSDRKSVV